MSSTSLDDLFGEGAELGRDVVVKARLRFRVHPPRHPAARDIVDRVVSAYGERLDEIVGEIAGVLSHADPRRSNAQLLVLDMDRVGDVVKAAVQQPFSPGSRGGKWYRDGQGHIRYGEKPEGKYMGQAPQDSPMPHVDHLQPRSFMGASGRDQEMIGFLVEHGDDHGFSDNELRFLSAWYGTDTEGGELFDAFLECAGLTREELKDGVTNFRFGSQQLAYEEAVFEFFAAQGSLFLGEDPTTPDQVEEWHKILNDEIKPLLDGVFIKYEEAKGNESLQRQFASEPERQRRRFFSGAARCSDDTRRVADSVVGDWKPERLRDVVVDGMRDLGLFARRARTERHVGVHGRPHLSGAVMMDGRLLDDHASNPLLGDKDKLTTLSPSQLMLLYLASELHRRWDSHTRSFSDEKQADVGRGELGEAVLAALSGKSSQWFEASDVVGDRLEELVDLLVVKLNEVNAREGVPNKHGPKKKQRAR